MFSTDYFYFIIFMISGFSFISSNSIEDYPLVESVLSVLPICDEFILFVIGEIEEEERKRILEKFPEKVKIFFGGRCVNWNSRNLFSMATNTALGLTKGEWCFYIQADEILPEWEIPKVWKILKVLENDKEVEGILFNYTHFYFGYVRVDRGWYQKEVRVIRFDGGKNIVSFGDAQSFGVMDGRKIRKIRVAETPLSIYHYGWARPMGILKKKFGESFFETVYNVDRRWLKRFNGKHPKIIENKIREWEKEWNFDISRCRFKIKDFKSLRYYILMRFEEITGLRLFTWKPYEIVRKIVV